MMPEAVDYPWIVRVIDYTLHIRVRGRAPLSIINDMLLAVFEVREIYAYSQVDNVVTYTFKKEDEHGVLRDISDIEQADLLVSGTVKWDGCADYTWAEKDGAHHICRRADGRRLGIMFDVIYGLAAEIMPQHELHLS